MNTAGNWPEFRTALEQLGVQRDQLHLRRRRRQHRLPDVGARAAARASRRAASARPGAPTTSGRATSRSTAIRGSRTRRTASSRPPISARSIRAYKWPLYGAYAGGTRQARFSRCCESKTDHDAADFRRMQFDSKGADRRGGHAAGRRGAARRRRAALAQIADLLAALGLHLAPADASRRRSSRCSWTSGRRALRRGDDRYRIDPDDVSCAPRRQRRPPGAVGEEHALDAGHARRLIVDTMRARLVGSAERFGADRAGWLVGSRHTYCWPHPLGEIGHAWRAAERPAPALRWHRQHDQQRRAVARSPPSSALSGPDLPPDRRPLRPERASRSTATARTSGHPGSPHFPPTPSATGRTATTNRCSRVRAR